MRTIIFALSALTLATTGFAASANDFVVRHGDLDLSNEQDQASLKQRIASGAREYCGSYSVPIGVRSAQPDATTCVAEVKKLAHQRMAALIREQTAKGG